MNGDVILPGCGMDYPPGGSTPPAWPLSGGRVLVHNHVRHTAKTRQGWRGFRFWTQDPSAPHASGLVKCDCGYAPDHPVHYAVLRDGVD